MRIYSAHIRRALGWGLLLLPHLLLALDPSKSLFQFRCRNWTSESGLPANGIKAIAQTKDGFLWLGTQKGLVRFDGVEFTTPSFPSEAHYRSHNVAALEAAADGELWYGFWQGTLGGYRGTTGFDILPKQSWLEESMNILSIRETRDHALWVGSDKGLVRWLRGKTNGTTTYENLGTIGGLFEDTQEGLWIGTTDKGLFCWQGGKLSQFPDPSLTNAAIVAIAKDQSGQLWVGTPFGLRCYGPNGRPKEIPPLYAKVNALLVDSQGVLWIGTFGEGLIRYQHNAYSYFRRQDGLVRDTVNALLEDREGSIWVGTSDGLSQLSDVKFPAISQTEGLADSMSHGVCASRQGGLWTATSKGFSWLDGRTVTNFSTEIGLPVAYIKRVFEASNRDVYLIDGNKGIEVFSGTNVVAAYTNLLQWPLAFAEDGQGVVAAISGDLFRVSRQGMVPYAYHATNAPPMGWIRDLCSGRDGSILVATVNGIFRLKNGQWRHWSVDDGLADYNVQYVCEDEEGVIWAGLTTGLARIKGDQIRNVGTGQGLLDDYINALILDDRGTFWVNSSRGIFSVTRSELNEFADGRLKQIHCKAYDGLDSVKTIDTGEVEFSGCKTSDGRVWFPTPLGVLMIDPAGVLVNKVAPPVHIQRVLANGYALTRTAPIAPTYGGGQLELQYTAPSFVAPQRVSFRYRLEGYDRDWVDAAGRRSALYANLKPGRYRFCVTAANADGAWSPSEESFEVVLPPYYYQTEWFKILCGLGVLALAGGIYTWRVRDMAWRQQQLQLANERLEVSVRERTAELAAKHKELLASSRQAGMAEVATNVLHNVGNVLNSVNVSAGLLSDRLKRSRVGLVTKTSELMPKQGAQLAHYLTVDPKGKLLPVFLEGLGRTLTEDNQKMLAELESLVKHIDHIKTIVAMQQSYAKAGGVLEEAEPKDLLEDALQIIGASLEKNAIRLVRDYRLAPPVTVDRHKVLQILINLISNAKHALETRAADKVLTLRVSAPAQARVQIQVADNGMGIAHENLLQIFSQGFTTRKEGHGFGLHSGALAAKELGGSLSVHSDGPGQGATFTLELPITD